jgi:RNA polymerase sigma factor (sigma-70 family)
MSATNSKKKIDVARVNKDNLTETIAEYQPRLWSFIRRRVEKKEDAEDILQDVLYQLANVTCITLNPIENAAAWLYRVARNTIINHGKKKREEKMPEYRNEDDDSVIQDFAELFLADDDTPESEYFRSLFWEELRKALAELPVEQREIFQQTELEGISVKEIAQTLEVPVNTLLSRKHYAVKHLRKRLQDLCTDFLET